MSGEELTIFTLVQILGEKLTDEEYAAVMGLLRIAADNPPALKGAMIVLAGHARERGWKVKPMRYVTFLKGAPTLVRRCPACGLDPLAPGRATPEESDETPAKP